MTIEKNYWKVWLRDNPLTKDVENDYTAEVSTSKNTLHNDDLARRIIAEGSEIKFDTLVSILNQADRVAREALMQGFSVMTGNVQMTPRVAGTWIGSAAHYDPTIHRTTADLVATKTLREALSRINVEVLGVKDATAFIGLVTNGTTGLTDGRFKPGDDLIIEGEKMKVVGDANDPVGIYLIAANDDVHPITHRLTQNDPKKIICRTPTGMPEGRYRLEVRTRYCGSTLLKDIRTIEYERPLIYSDGI